MGGCACLLLQKQKSPAICFPYLQEVRLQEYGLSFANQIQSPSPASGVCDENPFWEWGEYLVSDGRGPATMCGSQGMVMVVPGPEFIVKRHLWRCTGVQKLFSLSSFVSMTTHFSIALLSLCPFLLCHL